MPHNALLTKNGKPRVSPRPFKAKYRPPDYVTGRPTDYRPEYCDEVIRVMSDGYDLTGFAGYVGVSRDTVYNWQNLYPAFSDAVQKGKAARLFFLQRKLMNTAVGVGVTAAIFALKNAAPDDWQDRYNTTTDVNVRIESLTDAQLEAIAARAKPTLTIEHDPNE